LQLATARGLRWSEERLEREQVTDGRDDLAAPNQARHAAPPVRGNALGHRGGLRGASV